MRVEWKRPLSWSIGKIRRRRLRFFLRIPFPSDLLDEFVKGFHKEAFTIKWHVYKIFLASGLGRPILQPKILHMHTEKKSDSPSLVKMHSQEY